VFKSRIKGAGLSTPHFGAAAPFRAATPIHGTLEAGIFQILECGGESIGEASASGTVAQGFSEIEISGWIVG
jgi:hypothetical protein